MIIETPDGRHRSQTTYNEKVNNIIARWNILSDEEKVGVWSTLDEFGFLSEDSELGFENLDEIKKYSKNFHDIVESHYDDRIVTVEEFVKDSHYLGHVGKYFYPKWLEDMKELFANNYIEAIVTGAIGSGKTSWCDMCLSYIFYELCMLKNPQAAFGLMPNSEIVLVCFNRDKRLARDVTFGGLKKLLEPSPFFKDLNVKFGTSEIEYAEKNIRIIAISARSADAMGRNVFGGVIDETDFMEGNILRHNAGLEKPGEKSFAELLHSSITRRMKSRYDRAGIMPGKLLLSSSARHKTSFTNRRISEAAAEPNIFCRDYAIYDVAPADRFLSKRFWVMVGTERIRHKILSRSEYRALGTFERKKLVDQGCRFIRVPENFRPDFERNIEDSVREIAGIVTVSLSPFIQLQDKIFECVDPTLFHPMSSETWATDEIPYIDWNRLVKPYERKIGPGKKVMDILPIRHPEAPRHVHFDASLGVHDAAAICIAHVAGSIEVERRTGEGEPILDSAPLIEVDLILRVEAPKNGEINFASMRGIIYDFMKHGYTFNFASADRFQSHDLIQQLQAQGIDGSIISVDKTMEPYTYLKTAIYEGRLSLYNYPILLQELVHLQRDEKKQKIDHPPNGTKDCADSLAGIVYTLSTKIAERSLVMMGISEYENIEAENSEWIRKTMVRSGEDVPVKIGNIPESGGPIVFTG